MNNSQQSQRSTGRYNGEFKQYLGLDKKFGHLHEFREIPNSNPKAYTVKISVPQGQGNNIRYQDFELYVKTADALLLFMEHKELINDSSKKSTIRFSCTNLHTGGYIVQSGQRAGNVNTFLKGNLNYLFSVKIDGQQVYGYRPMGEAANDSSAEPSDQMESENVDTLTGEVLPNPSHDMPPTLEDVPAEAYEDMIDQHGSDMDVSFVTDDELRTDSGGGKTSPGRSQGKATPAVKNSGSRRSKAKDSADTTTN